MIKNDTLAALKDGYDVILEGILSVRSYGEVLEDILTEHPAENYTFYFDVSLEETLRRHATRLLKADRGFGGNDMREWYPATHRSDHKLEQIIPGTFSIDETIRLIRQASKF